MDVLDELDEYLQNNPEVVDSLNVAKSEEEVNAIFKQNGFDVTIAELKQLEQERDLSDEELKAIVGGCLCMAIGFGTTDGWERNGQSIVNCDIIGWGGGCVPT